MNKSINTNEYCQPANEVAAFNLSRAVHSLAVAGSDSVVDDGDVAKEKVKESPTSASSVSVSENIRHWQTSKKTIKERVEFMFNNEHLADVFFVVGKGSTAQRIPAHKFVLSVSSAVFDAMFNGVLTADSDQIEIPDVEPAAFFALLRFLYSDNVHIEPDTVMSTLYTAKKYAVPSLESCCVEFLEQNLASDNAFMLLSQARLFDEPRLADLCLKMIDKHTVDALAAEGFTDIDLETLCCVLARDTLRIKEGKLFQAVVRWSEAECIRKGLRVTTENQSKIAAPAIKLIRFPLLTVEEFASGPAQSGLLADRDIVSLFLYFIVNPKPQTEYIATPRSIMTGSELFVNRFPQLEMRWGYSGTCDRIKFTVDHQIFVIGFGLYGSVHTPSEYCVCIELIKTSTNKVIGRNDTTFTSDGSRSIFRIMFEEPVLIMPNISYIASATIKGPDSHYGTKGMRKVFVETPSGKITFQFSYSSGNNNGSSVEDGQIPQILFYV